MISSTRAARAEHWNSSLTFELDTTTTEPTGKSGEGKTRRSSRRPFASASAALTEGVTRKASTSYSPPPPKPKVPIAFPGVMCTAHCHSVHVWRVAAAASWVPQALCAAF